MQIKELTLYTSNLNQQIALYRDTLRFKIIDRKTDAASFEVGDSILSFKYKKENTPYHFAINIPSNQENEALQWLKERIEIIKYMDREIQYFDFWDAYAIYFYDADQNICEFIARRSLNKPSVQPFTSESLISISEIGIPTQDIERDYNYINQQTGIPIHSGNTERFCAAGDEQGLLIMINSRLKKYWYPTTDHPHYSDFNIDIVEASIKYQVAYKNQVFSIRVV